jgi:hypothetical protein
MKEKGGNMRPYPKIAALSALATQAKPEDR